METPKTAEEVLGETYEALLGSNKNFIISAMEEYAEQARREEREKSFEMLEMLQSCLSFIEELKNHGIDNWSDEGKLRALIKKATTIKQ